MQTAENVSNFKDLHAYTRTELMSLNGILSIIASCIEWIYMFVYMRSGRWDELGCRFSSYFPKYVVIPELLMLFICVFSNIAVQYCHNERFKNFIVLFANCLLIGVVISVHYVFAVVLALCVIPLFISTFFGDRSLVDKISISMLIVYTLALMYTCCFGNSIFDGSFGYNVGIVYALLFGVNIICQKLVATEGIKRRLYENSKHDAATDSLTSLPNLGAIYAKINELKLGSGAYIAIMDIDSFKQVNDRYGHDFGNTVLCRVAALMSQMVSEEPSVFAGRFGGDEFVMIANGISFEIFRQKLERLSASFSAQRYRDIEDVFTLSVGMTRIRFADMPESIIKDADKYLYKSKQSGKNRVTASKIP